MLQLLSLHTEHKQIKHSRKLVLPRFYDPAFVNERDLALIQVASRSSWAFPKLFSKTFVFFSGFHIFKATGCCRKRCRLVHFPADWEASDRRWCGLGQTSFSLFIIVTIVNRAANLGVEKPKSVTESFDILIGSRTSQLRNNRGRCVEPWCLSIFPSHCLLLVWFYWFWRWNPQTWTLAPIMSSLYLLSS